MTDIADIVKTDAPKNIINTFAVIIRNAQIHDLNNIAVKNAIEKFMSILNPITAKYGFLTLDLIGEFFFINQARIRYSMEFLLNFDFLSREFRKRRLGGITFNYPVTPQDLMTFLSLFISSAFTEKPFDALSEGVRNIVSIDVGPPKTLRDREESEYDIRKTAKKTYFNAVSFTKEVMNRIKSGEKVNIKKAKRVIESIVDIMLEQDEFLIGMTAIKDYDEYTYHHSVNVSILSVTLGHRLGLIKKALTELGLVAMFHDIGKLEVPPEILNKPTNFNEDEWEVIKKHPIWSMKTVLKLKGIDHLSIRAALVAFEHHLNYDITGYPRISRLKKTDLYTRIVSIADQYDGMTSSRVYARIAMAPDKALSVMTDRAGTQIDPLLFKFFINMIGVLPIGSLVQLDTKEIGLVYGSNAAFPDRPRVIIITDSSGNKIEGRAVDLSEKDDNGMYLRKIVKTIDPSKYGINLADYLL